MPVKFDEYEASGDASGWAIDPDSNAYAVLAFLAAQPETGFAPKEIHEATDLPRGSVGTTCADSKNEDSFGTRNRTGP